MWLLPKAQEHVREKIALSDTCRGKRNETTQQSVANG
jgi:hypothetical protein